MVDVMPRYVDMSITPEERDEDYSGPMDTANQPRYPYGLSISMCQDELEKLDLEDECEIGDMIELNCLAKVTSISKNDTESGTRTRVELQIIAIEAEGDDEQEVTKPVMGRKRPY